jgi:outer membrane protein assembly factor BamB
MRVNEDRVFGWYDENGDGAFDRDDWRSIMDILEPYLKDHGMLGLPVTGTGTLPDSIIKWKITDDTPETPSPLVVRDHILFITNGGIMTVIDRETGGVVKKMRVGAAGAYLSSPMLAANRIYICSFNGTVTVLSAEDFSVLASNKLKEKIGASPVAVDDVLYIRSDKHMYAFRNP